MTKENKKAKNVSSDQDEMGDLAPAVKNALGYLYASTQGVGKGENRLPTKSLTIPGTSNSLACPFDSAEPFGSDLQNYAAKLMEFLATFLVAFRVGKEVDVQLGYYTKFPAQEYMSALLHCMGRGTDRVERLSGEELRYWPHPHLLNPIQAPFVDFAGQFVNLSLDYLAKYGGSGKEEIKCVNEAVEAELFTAIKFIVGAAIKDDDGTVGWAFLAAGECATGGAAPHLFIQRQPLATAWAINALIRFSKWSKSTSKENEASASEYSKIIDQDLAPACFKWIEKLATTSGLFQASEKDDRTNLINHNYLTEALLTLAPLESKISGLRALTITAIQRFTEKLKENDEWEEFERNIYYEIYPKNAQAFPYLDRGVRANLLATLSAAFSALTEWPDEDDTLLGTDVKAHCIALYQEVLGDRLDISGIWVRGDKKFHWTLAAVEALLRYLQFGKSEAFQVTQELLFLAISDAIDNKEFRKNLTDKVLEHLNRRTNFAVFASENKAKRSLK